MQKKICCLLCAMSFTLSAQAATCMNNSKLAFKLFNIEISAIEVEFANAMNDLMFKFEKLYKEEVEDARLKFLLTNRADFLDSVNKREIASEAEKFNKLLALILESKLK